VPGLERRQPGGRPSITGATAAYKNSRVLGPPVHKGKPAVRPRISAGP
jgi:hypothetical protein